VKQARVKYQESNLETVPHRKIKFNNIPRRRNQKLENRWEPFPRWTTTGTTKKGSATDAQVQ